MTVDVAPGGPSRPRWPMVAGVVVAGVALGLVVVVVVGAVVWLRHLEDAPAVPGDWRAPTALPAAVTPLPAGWVVFGADRGDDRDLVAGPLDDLGDPDSLTTVVAGPGIDEWWPRLSPDRRTVLFYRVPAGTNDRDATANALWAAAADGSGEPVELRPPGLDGWVQQGHAEWRPDGGALVMFGGKRTNPQIWQTDPRGQDPVALTDRPGTNVDPAYGPDGDVVAFIGCPQRLCTFDDYEVYVLAVDVGGRPRAEPRRLTDDDVRDHDPAVAPDGATLAWLSQVGGGLPGVWDIRLAPVPAPGLRAVAESADHAASFIPIVLLGDDAVTSKPEWTRDGRWLVFHRLEPGTGDGFEVWRARPDGTGLEQLTTGPGTAEYPST